MLKVQIDLYESIKADLMIKLQQGDFVALGDIAALNSVNSALADLYKQLFDEMKAGQHVYYSRLDWQNNV